ncbi:MAG: hypothetical protein HQ525_01280, partial [Anaerolineae bacterium]|nr:hypothetical protein [Anaerolineae bacterium]
MPRPGSYLRRTTCVGARSGFGKRIWRKAGDAPGSQHRGTLSVDDRTNMLIVRDVAGSLNQVEQLVRSLDTQTPQVLVEARIV